MRAHVGRNSLASSIRELRRRLGDTQMQFSRRMGWHITTLARYETKRAPSGRVLVELEVAACNNGESELAKVFNDALCEELGYRVSITPPRGQFTSRLVA